MRRYRSGLVLLAMFLPLLSIISCKEKPLKSEWRTARIASDDPDTAWAHTRTYAWEDQNILLGLQNDTDRLVVLLRARDRTTQATMMRAGLTIWFDPTGKNDKTFGIHYPIGRQDTTGNPKVPVRPEERRAAFEPQTGPMPDTMEIIRADKRLKVPIENNLGVSIWTSNSYGTITYLLSVPLKTSGDSTYGIDAAPGSVVGLGFETGTARGFAGTDRERESPDEMGQPDSGFGGNPGEWSERGRSMPRRPRMGRHFEPVNFWTQVTLASAANKNNR
jgi:hypothetical protein